MQMTWRFVCLLIWGATGVCPGSDMPIAPGEQIWTSLAIATNGDPILLPVAIGGGVFPFLLDSGSDVHAFDPSLGEHLGAATGTSVASTIDLVDVELERFTIPPLHVGGLFVASSKGDAGLVFDFRRLRQLLEQDVRGTLGAPFFCDKVVQLDFDQGVLRLATRLPTDTDCGTPLPLRLDASGRLWLDDVKIDGRVESFAIATGMNNAVVLHKWLFGKLIAGGQLAVEEGDIEGETIAGVRTARRGRLAKFTCGEYTHCGLLAEEGGINALGLRYLARYTVTVNAQEGQLFLKPGVNFNQPDKIDRTGLDVEKVHDVITVKSVGNGTPAAAAGVKEGDRIVTIDGAASAGMRIMEFNRRLRDSAGQELRLVLDRRGVRIEVTLKIETR